MPYQNEFAQYNSVRRMSENLRVRELLRQYRLSGPEPPDEADTSLYRLVSNDHGKTAPDQLPEFVLSIDGSYVEVPVPNGVLSAGLGYVTITDVLLDLGELIRLDQNRPVDPRECGKTTMAGAVDTVLAGCNIIFDGELDPQSSFRRGVIDLLREKQALAGGETLLDSYEALLAYKPLVPLQRCPYGATCEHTTPQSAYERVSGTKACECPLKLAVHSTDALRIYEKFNPLEKMPEPLAKPCRWLNVYGSFTPFGLLNRTGCLMFLPGWRSSWTARWRSLEAPAGLAGR
ncbi:MAG: hypothetical protein IPO41_07210 [Acidobacteria bacterium]|nr:hypothetical protein [Acidobacteriota bacterium]